MSHSSGRSHNRTLLILSAAVEGEKSGRRATGNEGTSRGEPRRAESVIGSTRSQSLSINPPTLPKTQQRQLKRRKADWM